MRTRLYGLLIDLTPDVDGLPRLVPDAPPDLTIDLGTRPPTVTDDVPNPQSLWYVGPHLDANGQPELAIYRLPDGSLLMRYSDGVSFLIACSLELIQGWWSDSRELGDALGYLLGPVLGLILRLRGRVCLHAGGVVIDGSAHLFVGNEGAGKSTTTAALLQRGHRFLTDDIAALDETRFGFVVHAGVPRIFLEPSSIQGLGVPGEHVQRQSSTWDKSFVRCLPAGPTWCREACPLKTLFVLKQGPARLAPPECRPLQGFLAMAAVVAHTYANRTLDARQRAVEFQFLGRLLEHVRVVLIHFSSGFDSLQDVCRMIEAEGSEVGSPGTMI